MSEEPRVITVRVPPALHDALVILAWSQKTSMNRACVSMIEKAVAGDENASSVYESSKARRQVN